MTRTSGFTLIEILASMLLFALGLAAVIGVIAYGGGLAMRTQADATAWVTAQSVLKDPMPFGSVSDPATGMLSAWTWTNAGASHSASDGSAQPAWQYTSWPVTQASDVLTPDMGAPIANNPAVFPSGGMPISGCAHGFLNGYYVERREQSRQADQISATTRIVEVRVDVYWAGYSGSDGRPLVSLVDRVVRQGGL